MHASGVMASLIWPRCFPPGTGAAQIFFYDPEGCAGS